MYSSLFILHVLTELYTVSIKVIELFIYHKATVLQLLKVGCLFKSRCNTDVFLFVYDLQSHNSYNHRMA